MHGTGIINFNQRLRLTIVKVFKLRGYEIENVQDNSKFIHVK